MAHISIHAETLRLERIYFHPATYPDGWPGQVSVQVTSSDYPCQDDVTYFTSAESASSLCSLPPSWTFTVVIDDGYFQERLNGWAARRFLQDFRRYDPDPEAKSIAQMVDDARDAEEAV